MCKVHYVADFFIDSALNDPENNMTNMRINKLLYFAQGWSLARYGKPLFTDEIEAWDYGPVVPPIYHRLKTSGRDKIKGVMDEDYASHFTKQESRLLIDILHAYDRYSTAGLVEMTHQPGTPWSLAKREGRGAIISKDSMKAYFSKLPSMPTFKMPDFHEADFIGHRNAAGHYILPEDWNDDE